MTLHIYNSAGGQNLIMEGYRLNGDAYIVVTVQNGIIESVREIKPPANPGEKTFIAPGLIDTQVNGYAAVSFNEKGLTNDKIEKLTAAMWKEGVTTFFPTIITNSPELIRENLRILANSAQDPVLDHCMPGYFLEGPYISSIDGFRGAHDKNWTRDPDWNEFMTFNKAANGRIKLIGLAPELPGAMDFIEKTKSLGVFVSLAHHNGSSDQISIAVSRGATVSTHLGNGCANLIPRHDNPIWPQLANIALTPSVIADGHHLRKEELQVFFKVKGPDHLMLVSDATELSGMPPGEYDWNGKIVVMTPDGMLQYPEQQVLAGASFPVKKGIATMMNWVGCSLEEAVTMATKTPARTFGLNDRGELKKGMAADLILFTLENNEPVIKETVVLGKKVFEYGK